jgi:hypothetical protein
MFTSTLPLGAKVKIIFKGFLITDIRHGSAEASIGAIRTSDCHQPRIGIKEIAADGRESLVNLDPADLKPDANFSFLVENASLAGVEVFQKDDEPFNRLDDENDRQDFRWFLSLEEIHGKPLVRDTNQLFPVFTINSGIFYTDVISPGEVRLIRKGGRPAKRFGQFALDIAANVYLDQPNSRLLFNKEARTLLEIDAPNPSTFVIVVDCNCDRDLDESDFPLVYDVIGGSVADPDRLDFTGDPKRTGFNRNPEVYCAGGN